MLSKPGGKPLFFHDTDSGTILFAQRSGVVGIAEQAGIVSHDEGGEDIQKLLFFQIVRSHGYAGWEGTGHKPA